MTKLMFDGAAVRVLFDHAKGSKEHSPTFSMLFDKKYLKEGETLDKDDYARPEQIDKTKIPAHLTLVKDQGAYLMSSGIPRLPGKDTHNHVVYANGFGPDADWDRVQAALGGDDFAEGLPLEMFERAMADKAPCVWINVTRNKISIGWERGNGAEAPPPARVRPAYDKQQLSQVHAQAGGKVRPKWAQAGASFKGPIAGVASTVVFQIVGNGARRGVVVHERALLPEPVPTVGAEVTIIYPDDRNAVAAVKAVAKR